MPLFMFISGFLTRYTNEERGIPDAGKYIWKKVVRLLVPYLALSTTVHIALFMFSDWRFTPEDFSVGELLYGLLDPRAERSSTYYWFLPTVFIIIATSVLLLKTTGKEWLLAIPMGVSLVFNLMGTKTTDILVLNDVLTYFVWWGAGFYFCKWQGAIVKGLRLYSDLVCVGLLAVIVAGIWWPLPEMAKHVFGILLCVSFGLVYLKRRMHFLDHLFGYSFPVYLLSWFGRTFALILVGELFAAPGYILWPAGLAAGVYLPWLVARFVKVRWPQARALRVMIGV
jgi:fucose 4-O-acetylase-like acetyltransferase